MNPRVAVVVAFLFVLAPAAGAQIVGWSKKDPDPVFGPPRPPAESRPTSVPSAPEDPAAELIKHFSEWPKDTGLAAAKATALGGKTMAPRLLGLLGSGDWRVRAAAAFALGEMRAPEAYAPIKTGLGEIGNRIALEVHFAALAKIDPKAAVGDLLPYVAGPDARFARDAFEAMPRMIDPIWRSSLEPLLDRSDDTTRARALDLLARTGSEAPRGIFLDLLGDKSPKVAKAASDEMATKDDDAAITALLAALDDGGSRRTCYATLTLVRIEDRTGKRLLPGEGPYVQRLFRYLTGRSDFEKATAAVALANISMRSTDDTIRKIADRRLVFDLINAAAGGVLFGDYGSVRELCFKKAEMISGQHFGENGERWKEWWLENGRTFAALRELENLGPEEAMRAVFEIRVAAAEGREAFVGVFAARDTASESAIRPILVPEVDLARLVAALRAGGFFGGAATAIDDAPLVLMVRLDRAEKRRAYGGDALARFADALAVAKELEAREEWQTLWTRLSGKPFAEWHAAETAAVEKEGVEARRPVWVEAGIKDFAALDGRGRRFVLASAGRLGADYLESRAAALTALLAMRSATAADVATVVDLLAAGKEKATADGLVQALLARDPEGNDEQLTRFLGRRPALETAARLKDRRIVVRRAAITALVPKAGEIEVADQLVETIGTLSPETVDLLKKSFGGAAPAVFLDRVERLAKEKDAQGRLQAAEILGALAGDRAVPVLVSLLSEKGPLTSFAVIRGLRAAATPAAVDALFDIADGDHEAAMKDEALRAVRAVRSPYCAERLRERLKADADPASTAFYLTAAIDVFGEAAGRELEFLLRSENLSLRKRTVRLLAEAMRAEAVPGLIEELSDPAEAAVAEEFLEWITCRRQTAVDLEKRIALWREWWESHRNESETTWFSSAVAERGLPAGDLTRALAEKRADPQAAALLIHVMKGDEWALRVRAHQALAALSGERFGMLTKRSTPDETARVIERWEKWRRVLELRQ